MANTRLLAVALVVSTALVSLALLSTPAAGDVRGRPHVDVFVPDNRVVPGEEATIELTLLNDPTVIEGSTRDPSLTDVVTTARGVRVKLGKGNAPITVKTSRRAIGNVPEGASPPVPFRVVVDEDAKPGKYEVPVIVEYTWIRFVGEEGDSGRPGRRYEDGARSRFEITLLVEERPRFEVRSVDSNVSVGESGSVTVRIANVGAIAAENARLSVRSPNAAVDLGSGEPDATTFAGTWVPGEVRAFTFRTAVQTDAVLRRYALEGEVEYEDADGLHRTSDPLSFGITPNPEQSFAVDSVDAGVAVGESGRLTVRIVNEGTIVAENARLAVHSRNDAVTLGTGEPAVTSFAGDWGPGEVRAFTFRAAVQTDAVLRRYALEAEVTYENAEGLRRTSDPLPFGITPNPEQSFAVESVESSIRVGEEGRLTGYIENTGGATARNAVVVLDAGTRTITVQETEVALGDLSPGERAAFAYDLEVNEAAEAGARQFSLVVRHRGSDGATLRSDQIDVRASVAGERDVFEVTAADAVLRGSGSGELELVVRNVGEEPVTGVSAKLFADDPLSATDDEAFVDRLEPGERANVSFRVSVDRGALEKTYPVSVDFQYDDADGDTLISDSYRLPVSVVPAVDRGFLPFDLSVGVPAAILAGVILGAGLVLGSVGIYARRRDDR